MVWHDLARAAEYDISVLCAVTLTVRSSDFLRRKVTIEPYDGSEDSGRWNSHVAFVRTCMCYDSGRSMWNSGRDRSKCRPFFFRNGGVACTTCAGIRGVASARAGVFAAAFASAAYAIGILSSSGLAVASDCVTNVQLLATTDTALLVPLSASLFCRRR